MKLTPRPLQEEAIALALAQIGTSNGCLIGDEPGVGKTLIGVEFALQAMREHGWTRILLIALPDTHKQWADGFMAQSEGAVEPRIMDGTKQGRANYEAFMKREEGVFIGGSHYLTEKDWQSEIVRDDNGHPVFARNKKTGLPKTKLRKKATLERRVMLIERAEGEIGPAQIPRVEWKARTPGAIGPAAEPEIQRKSVRKLVFYKKFYRHPLDAVIIDEVQVMANKKSHANMTINSIKSGYRMAMSGTWFMNKLENQWTIAKWCWPGVNPATGMTYVVNAHATWKAEYLAQEPVYGKDGRVLTTPKGGTVMRTTGEKDPGAFTRSLPAYRRIEKDERAPEASLVYVEPTPQQAAQQADLEADLMTWVTDWRGEEAPLVVDLPMTLRTRLRQVAIAALSLDFDPDTEEEVVYFADDAPSSKLKALRGILEFWRGKPVGIFTDSKIAAHLLAKRMCAAGLDARAWTGDLSRTERQALKDSFIRGEFQYLIGTVQSMGTGIDGLQKATNKVVWISEVDGNPALNEQAINRYFRPGRIPDTEDDQFQQVKILTKGTVDEQALELLLDKAWRIRAAMNGGIAA